MRSWPRHGALIARSFGFWPSRCPDRFLYRTADQPRLLDSHGRARRSRTRQQTCDDGSAAGAGPLRGWAGLGRHSRRFPDPGRVTPGLVWDVRQPVALQPRRSRARRGRGHGFAWQPLALGAAFGVGGLFLGWWVYGRRPIEARDESEDPLGHTMARFGLGWLYRAMHERFYVDTLYRWLITKPAVALARVSADIDRRIIDAPIVAFGRGFGQAGRLAPTADQLDRGLLDRLVEGVGTFSRSLAQWALRLDMGLVDGFVKGVTGASRMSSDASGLVDGGLIDGVVTGIARMTGAIGKWSRKMQSGLLPDYLWNAFMIIILLAAILVLLQRI